VLVMTMYVTSWFNPVFTNMEVMRQVKVTFHPIRSAYTELVVK
jgi:hypothetical protein